MSEVRRYYVGKYGLVEGESLGRLSVVLAAEFDRVTAERDALSLNLKLAEEGYQSFAEENDKLQQRLTAADERVDLLERDKARIDWLAEQPVDTLYLDDGRIIDIAGRVDLRDAIDAAMAEPKTTEGGEDVD